MAGSLFENNEAGHFQVKQAFITGNMTVRTTEGTYWQGLGKITTYKNVATIGFGREKGEGSADIGTIPVIFSDGSKAKISGLVRLKLPAAAGIQLKREYSEGYMHFITSGVLPVVRNAVKLSANLRTAQDAYTTLALFQQAVQDQLENGTYVTKADKVEVVTSTGDTEIRQVTVIVRGENGLPLRRPNRLMELNCEILECVIDVPDFDTRVEEMIAKRKDEAMKTELAKQSAIRAKQDALTSEAQGKANVAKAKYEEEVIKVKAVTVAEKEYQVAQLNARKALEEKKKVIAEGQAEAEANRLKVKAGLTPQERAEWDYKTKVGVASEMAKVKFPELMIIGGNGDAGALNPFEAVGLESFIKIQERLSK
jgi:hypothetical protein